MLVDGSNRKADAYQATVTSTIETFFPLITTRRKSTDLPWVNSRIRRRIKQRKAIFRCEGRSARWRRHKNKTEELIATRREGYFRVQKDIILATDGSCVFFKNVRRYKSADKPPEFDVRTLCPGASDPEVAEKLAAYFNEVSQEFQALEPADIPTTHHRILPVLAPWQVAGRIKPFKKPKSMVHGDVFPKLMTLFADQFALPLASIYNEITATFIWPQV